MPHSLVRAIATVILLAADFATLSAQVRPIGEEARPFVRVAAPVVALTHARVGDGTGAAARDDQTIVIQGEHIRAIGAASAVAAPAGAEVLDLTGHTVIPGIVGLHDHLYYSSAAGGSMQPMLYSYPRLFLATGVTTIRSTGSVDSYRELNLRRASDDGEIAAPEIVVTGPYLQGPGPDPAAMHPLEGERDARRAELRAAIDEAHKHGVKVTAHLCSVTFREAVALGIDNLEHGLITDTSFWEGKKPDQRPTGPSGDVYGELDVASEPVRRTIRDMVKHGVALTSTLAVFELSSPSRLTADQRVLDALFPEARGAAAEWYAGGTTADDSLSRVMLKKAMQFERAFVAAGGLLAAGSDPCCLTAIAGYADQRNYELLVEVGFTAEEAIRIMTANGARVLGIDDRVGTIAVGKQADLVVIRGDPVRKPDEIRNAVVVFRRGLGYDSAKLIESVRGLVGIK